MRRLLLPVIAALLITGAAAATESAPSSKATDYQDESTCNGMAVKQYLAAVDPSEADWQEWHLNAASAYEHLDSLGFTEC